MKFRPDATVIDRETFMKSGARDYLKGPVLGLFFDEYPDLEESIFKDSFSKRHLLESLFDHTDDGTEDLTGAEFLRALSDLYDGGRLKRYQIEDSILKAVFPEGVPSAAKDEFLWWRQATERSERSENRTDSEVPRRKESPVRIMLRQIGL